MPYNESMTLKIFDNCLSITVDVITTSPSSLIIRGDTFPFCAFPFCQRKKDCCCAHHETSPIILWTVPWQSTGWTSRNNQKSHSLSSFVGGGQIRQLSGQATWHILSCSNLGRLGCHFEANPAKDQYVANKMGKVWKNTEKHGKKKRGDLGTSCRPYAGTDKP